MITIKSININSIRGIKECDLSPDGKSLIIFGENGTGKSSIVDAIEFFFTGGILHLKSSQSLSIKHHGTHVRCSPSDVRVSLQFNPGGRQITRTFFSDFQTPKEYQDFFDIARKGTFILRRSQIMDFIYSKPAERFRVISKILGIEYLDDVEAAFKKTADYFSTTLKEKIGYKDSIIRGLSESLSTEVSNSNGILNAINSRITECNVERLESLDDLEGYISNLSKNLVSSNDSTLVNTLNQICKSSSILIEGQLKEKVREVEIGVDILLKEDMIKKLSYSNLLQGGKEMLAQHGIPRCPLCEHDINRVELLNIIDRNLLSLDAMSKQALKIKDNCSFIYSEFL